MKKNKINYSKIDSLKHYFKYKIPSQSGMEIVFGKRGSGKSTNIAKDYYQWLKTGKEEYKHFYTNQSMNLKDNELYILDLNLYKFTDYIEPNKITKKYRAYTNPVERGLKETPFKILPNSIVEIDEIGIIAHSRNYKDFDKEFINFIKILRKLGIYFKCCSQNYDIDKSLRNGANELRLMSKILWFNISRKINKFIDINTSSDENGNADSQIVDKVEFASILEKNALKITFIPFYTDLFNSFE